MPWLRGAALAVSEIDPNAPAWSAWVDFEDPLDAQAPRLRRRFGQVSRWLVAYDATQVAGLLDAAHAWSQAGNWAVGWVAYEAATGLDPSLPVKALPPGQVYAAWALYAPQDVFAVDADPSTPWQVQGGPAKPAEHDRDHTDTQPYTGTGTGNDTDPDAAADTSSHWRSGPWRCAVSAEQFDKRVQEIHRLIEEGEVYQVNYTALHEACFEGSDDGVRAYFEALRRAQSRGYGLALDARAVSRSPGWILSASPELFFDWHGQRLSTRPMKGTASRHADPQADAQAAQHLRDSDKERAENLMIVDLLRNDLSKIAQTGSVEVSSLFEVKAWPTVWQMTSTIRARSRPQLKLSEVFAALFPCGSVTGAPKQRAMHHIARLEAQPRGVYCGALGVLQPGGRATFNVPIRTVTLNTPPPPAPWTARCGIGSGITLDATAPAEWQEWASKRAFLERAQAPFELLESLRLEHGVLARRAAHRDRMLAAARDFAWPVDYRWAQRIDHCMDAQAQAHPQGLFKVRILLSASGRVRGECAPLVALTPPSADPGQATEASPACAQQARPGVCLAERAMDSADAFVFHKTTFRPAYEGFRPKSGCIDTLLFNARDELTEFTIGNLAIELDGQWLTPPLSCGLLPGVMRGELLRQGKLLERIIPRSALAHATGLALINSVRGWVDVRLVSPPEADC